MINNNHSATIDNTSSPKATSAAKPMTKANPWATKESLAAIRTTARDFPNPVDYQHPYPSMARFAEHLALQYDANRTRHSYYRQLRLIHQHCGCDPVTITEAQLRDYFLFVKLKKHWKPKSIRQALAAATMFFVNLFGHTTGPSSPRFAPKTTTRSRRCSPGSRFAICSTTSACAATAPPSSSSTVVACA